MLVTISRMYGSGGSEVAQRVASALGWELIDNEFVDKVAERLGMAPSVVAEHEERVPSLGERIVKALSLSAPETARTTAELPAVSTEEAIVDVTRRVIDDAVRGGNAVLVGRGAQCVLGARADVVHAFCFAPRPALVSRVRARLGVSPEEAERITMDTNRQREQYVKRHFKRDWLAYDNYHVCVNTDWLGIGGAADVIVRLARQRFGL